MAWFYAVLFMVGNVMLIIGTGLLLALHARLTKIQEQLALIETRTPRLHPSKGPAVFRRAHDGAITKTRGVTAAQALRMINDETGQIARRARYGRPGEGL